MAASKKVPAKAIKPAKKRTNNKAVTIGVEELNGLKKQIANKNHEINELRRSISKAEEYIVQVGTPSSDDVIMQIRVDDGLADMLRSKADIGGMVKIPDSLLIDFLLELEEAATGGPELAKKNVMTDAEAIIYGDREKTYGHPALNLETIAQLWTVYISRKAVTDVAKDPSRLGQVPAITISDVCQMMVLLKTARLLNDPNHRDSQVDQIGYVALQERCS